MDTVFIFADQTYDFTYQFCNSQTGTVKVVFSVSVEP